jgi:hypothetical protein
MLVEVTDTQLPSIVCPTLQLEYSTDFRDDARCSSLARIVCPRMVSAGPPVWVSSCRPRVDLVHPPDVGHLRASSIQLFSCGFTTTNVMDF